MAVSVSDLTKLYLAYFGRPPDFDGIQFYTSPAHANLTIADVAAGFSASAESQALYGSSSLAGLINNIYLNIFGRAADVSGLQFWSDAINTGKVTPALAAYNILSGALLLNNLDAAVVLNKLAVATAWDQALNLPEEIVGYSGTAAAASARAFLSTVDGSPASLAAHSGAALDAAIAAAINSNAASLSYIASVSSPVVDEGNSGTTQLAFVIHLDHPAVGNVTVNYQTLITGTAIAGTDYIATAGTVTFANGQQDAVVNVTVNGDITVENNDTVVLQITGAQLSNGPVVGTGTITNDDVEPLLTQTIDNIVVQGTGPNTIKGVVDGTTPSNSTFSIGDHIVGNGATVLELDVAATGNGAFAFVDNVAAVNVIAGAAGPISFNAIEWHDVGSINLVAGVDGMTVNVSNLEEGAGLSIGASIAGQVFASYTTGMAFNLFNFGDGGAVYDAVNRDITVHINDNTVSAGAVIAASHDVVLGDVVIDGGANSALALLSISASGDVSINGHVSMSVGSGTSATDLLLIGASGDIDIVGNVVQIGGTSASALVTLSASGDVDIAGVNQTVGSGTSALDGITINAGGSVNAGVLTQVAQTGAVENINIVASGDISVDGIVQQGAASATANLTTSGDIDVGNVTQSATGFASLSISDSGSGTITVLDISQVAGTNAFIDIHGVSGDIDVGFIAQNFGGTSGTISVTSTTSGDISVDGISQIGSGTGANALAHIYGGTSGGDVSVGLNGGNVFQSVSGSGGFMSLSVVAHSSGNINVGDVTQIGGFSGSAFVGLYGSADVTVHDVNMHIGDASATAGDDIASFSLTASGDVSVHDVTVVAGVNENARVYISNSGTGDVTIHDVDVEIGGNTNTTTANTRQAGFFAYNLNTTGDLTINDVTMVVGATNTGTMSVSLDGTFNESLGNLAIHDIAVTLADKATFVMDIEATTTASTSATATNVVDVGDLTVGDIDVVMGTNASFSLSLDHSLFQSGSDIGGDVGDTNVGLISVSGGVGANVTIDVSVSNTVSYTTSGTAALVVKGGVGDVSFGGFDIVVDDGGSISVSVDIDADGAIGNVGLGDLKAQVGVSGTVANFDVSVSGSSVGDVTIGDISLIIGQSGSATDGIDVVVKATAGDLGNVTVGDISLADGESATNQTVSLTFTASGDIGDLSFGNVTMFNGVNGSMDGLRLNVTAGGDIGDFSMGDYTATAATSASFSTMFEVHLTADNIGDVTFGTSWRLSARTQRRIRAIPFRSRRLPTSAT